MERQKETKQLEFFAVHRNHPGRKDKSEAGIIPARHRFHFPPGWEKLTLGTIGCILVFLVAFILGVEKGKRLRPGPGVTDTEIQIRPEQELPRAPEQLVTQEIQPAKTVELVPVLAENAPVVVSAKEDISAVQPKQVYTIQVITISKKKHLLDDYLSRLKKMGYEPFELTTDRYFVLCVGRFTARKDAMAPLQKLRGVYGDCFVRKLVKSG